MSPDDSDSCTGRVGFRAFFSLGKRERDRPAVRRNTDRKGLMLTAAVVSTVSVLLFMIVFILYNSSGAIMEIGLWEFLTGPVWSPGTGQYGASSLIIGTVLVTGGAVLIAVPAGVGIAVYLNDVASPRVRRILKPTCEIFAGIPSVIYGFVGLVAVIPLLMKLFPDQLVYGTSWLAGSLLLAVMALPTIISVSHDSLSAVPASYREASMALGATKWETTRNVLLHSAMSGIVAATILGIGRAIGETMVVMMVCGNAAMLPEPLWNIFSMIRTMTASIALEMPETVFGSLHFSALFLLALVLMIIVLLVNIAAKRVVRRTKARMGAVAGEESSGCRSSVIWNIIRPHAGGIAKAMMYLAAFAAGAMWASLFADVVSSIAAGAAACMAVAAGSWIFGRIGPGAVQKVVYGGLGAMAACMVAVLLATMALLLVNGLPAISLEFLFAAPSQSGMAGGIWPAIVGTLELLAGTALIAIPLGVLSGVYFSQYAKDGRAVNIARQAIDTLNGTPSIIFGLFGMSVLVIWLGLGYSLIGGCITLALMIVPTIIKTTEEAVSAVPRDLAEASYAMGAGKWHTVWRVIVPTAMGGVLTGVILGLGRSIGETAPIMFTAAVAFKTVVGVSLLDPIMALPYHLYYLLAEVPGSTANQYGTALVLMAIVVGLFATASLVRSHYQKKIGC
jgi:phosphate transport system permease protein